MSTAPPERRIMSWLPVASAWTAIVALWATANNRLDSVHKATEAMEQRDDRQDNALAELRAKFAENTQLIGAVNDRFSAQAARLGGHEQTLAGIMRDMGDNARLIATLTERLAGQVQADNPRMREIEQILSRLQGITDEHSGSLRAIRELLVADARAGRPLSRQPGRE